MKAKGSSTSSTFTGHVMENWQSEYLQFTLYILGTVWLLQGIARVKGSRQGLGRHR